MTKYRYRYTNINNFPRKKKSLFFRVILEYSSNTRRKSVNMTIDRIQSLYTLLDKL